MNDMTVNRRLEVGSRKIEVGSWKLEDGRRKIEGLMLYVPDIG